MNSMAFRSTRLLEAHDAARHANFRVCLSNFGRERPKCVRNLADECASYLVLGLEGPSASTEEIKKAYRAPAARFLASRLRKST